MLPLHIYCNKRSNNYKVVNPLAPKGTGKGFFWGIKDQLMKKGIEINSIIILCYYFLILCHFTKEMVSEVRPLKAPDVRPQCKIGC